jgi:PAT family beta-lactamase induction signal transducer AmpG
VTYTSMAALMTIGIITTLIVREPEARVAPEAQRREQRVIDWLERNAHWPEPLRRAGARFIDAVVCPLVDFFARYGVQVGILVLVFICTYRLTDFAMGVMANPFYIDAGFTLKEIAAVVKGPGLVMSILGVLLGGTVVAKFGTTRALVLGSVLIIGSNLAYAALAAADSPSRLGLALANGADNLALGVHGTALIAFLSSLTSARYTATQYALFSSLYALPGKFLMGASGFVVDAIGYPSFFLYTASLSIPGLVLLYWLVRHVPVTQAHVQAK